FRAVERVLCALEERLRIVALGQLRDASGKRQALDDAERLRRHRPFDAAIKLRGLSRPRLGEDDPEFIAAYATGDVGRAQHCAQPRRRLCKHCVSREVSDSLIDRLEVVDIQDEQCEAATVTLTPRAFALESLMEVPA